MRWIGRFFLVIALVFLALDITDPIAGPAGTGAAAPAADGAATGGTDGTTTGGTTTDGTTSDGTTTGGTTSDGATTGGTTDGATTGGTTGSESTDGGAAAGNGDAATPGTPNRVVLSTLGERWFQYHSESYLQVSPAVSRHVSPWLDDSIVQPLMLQPAFLIFFALWLIFSFFSWLIGRGRRYDDDEDW